MPELPVLDGASASIQFDVGSAKTDTVVFHVSLEDGAIAASGAGPIDDPDFTVIVTRPEFDAVIAGALRLDVGYMQGRVKVVGNVGRLLSVMPVLVTDEWTTALREVAAGVDGLAD